MSKMMSKREKGVLVLAGAVIVLSALFNYVVLPLLSRNDILNKRIVVTRAKLKRYVRLLARRDQIVQAYGTLMAGGSSADAKSGASAYSELEAFAQTANIRIIDVRPQAAHQADGYTETVIDVRAEGTLEGYLSFIYSLQGSLSMFHVNRLQLTAKSSSPLLESNISLLHYSASD